MKILIKIAKGMLIGISSITPGVSGSMIATSFNIYEELIDALSLFTKKPFKAIYMIKEYMIGIVLGILFGAFLISKLLIAYPLIITLFFIGLILGSLPDIVKEEKNKEFKWYNLIIMVVAMILVLLLLFLPEIDLVNISGFKLYLLYLLIGFLVAVPLIIPGISGATILMIIGVYSYFTNLLDQIRNSIANLDFSLFLNALLPIFLMVISAFIGLLIVARGIKYILNNHRSGFNFAVMGLLLVAPINIIYSTNREVSGLFNNLSFWTILFSVILFIAGFALTLFTSFSGKEEVENEEQSA